MALPEFPVMTPFRFVVHAVDMLSACRYGAGKVPAAAGARPPNDFRFDVQFVAAAAAERIIDGIDDNIRYDHVTAVGTSSATQCRSGVRSSRCI